MCKIFAPTFRCSTLHFLHQASILLYMYSTPPWYVRVLWTGKHYILPRHTNDDEKSSICFVQPVSLSNWHTFHQLFYIDRLLLLLCMEMSCQIARMSVHYDEKRRILGAIFLDRNIRSANNTWFRPVISWFFLWFRRCCCCIPTWHASHGDEFLPVKIISWT